MCGTDTGYGATPCAVLILGMVLWDAGVAQLMAQMIGSRDAAQGTADCADGRVTCRCSGQGKAEGVRGEGLKRSNSEG
eukprot:3489558-Rhodomonas_salina.1